MSNDPTQQPSTGDKIKRGFIGAWHALTPWVKYLLIANFAVAGLTLTGVVPMEWVIPNLALDVDTVLQRPWTLLTHMFVHGGAWHLLANMLLLFFLGPPLEKKLGGGEFLKFYLLCGLGAAVMSLALAPWIGGRPMVGASGALFGVFIGFALFYPNAELLLMFILPVKARTLAWWAAAFSVGVTVAVIFFGLETGIAEWAHLGGLLTGLGYLRGKRYFRGSLRVLRRWGQPRSDTNGLLEKLQKDFRGEATGQEEQKMQEILEKVRQQGPGSLTPEERRFFQQGSTRMKGGEW